MNFEPLDECLLYFVGFAKQGRVQHLEAGPFCSWNEADNEVNRRDQPRSGDWVVCSVTLPFKVVTS